MRILLVAADAREYGGLLGRAARARQAPIAVDFARQAEIGGHEALLVANGAGWERAAAAVDAAAEFRPEAIVSMGFCGALDAALEIGDVVAGTAVTGAGKQYPCEALDAPRRGVVASIDHVAQTATEKAKLREMGAIAVEMEAAGVAARAEKAHTKFFCVRVVTDLAGETLANDFNGALRRDGHFDTMFILRGALRRPTERAPELLRLRRRSIRAAQMLGDFLVGCRF